MSKLRNLRLSIATALVTFVTYSWLVCTVAGAPLQLLSQADPALGPSASAGGDSYYPITSPDGRFVLFASTANNLVQIGTNPMPAVFPAPINVFLRDRTNRSTILVSLNLIGTGGGNADSVPIGVSTNGRYVLFESSASNLVPNDTNNASDVFVRDVISGTTVLVSASTNSGFADNASYNSVMTPDGRFVAFASAADNIVAGDTNGIPDVFVRDLANKVTTLVSAGARNRAGSYTDIGSDIPVLTPDSRYVAFYSTAANLVPGVATLGNIYLRDLVSGTTTCASTGALPVLQSLVSATNAVSFSPALSADGRYVAFEATPYQTSARIANVILRYDAQSGLTDLIETNAALTGGLSYQGIQNIAMTPDGRFVAYAANAIDTSGNTTAIRLWDSQTGTNILVSGNMTNGVLAGSLSTAPILDPTGRFVVFQSSAPDLVTNSLQGDFHLYLRDVQSGAITLVDTETNGVGCLFDSASTPAMSADARFIAFDSLDPSLVPLDRNGSYDVFMNDLAAATTELISIHDPALPCVAANGGSAISAFSLSSDGRLVAFWSDSTDLVANDTNGLRDVYVRDVLNGANLLISVNTNGAAGDGLSTDPAISMDGRFVAFTSAADDLVAGDTNRAQDVFVSTLPQGGRALVSVNYAGTGPGNSDSFSPILSSNGQFVLFHSRASNLTPGMPMPRTENLFLRDLVTQSTFALTTNGVAAASITSDGRFVAYLTKSISSAQVADLLYLWDSKSASIVYNLTGFAFTDVAISPDGQRIGYAANNGTGTQQLWAIDRALGTNWPISSFNSGSHATPRFSADDRFLANVGAVGSTNQIYLYDFQSGTNLLLSQSYDASGPGDSDSDSPNISSDGRFVSYRSASDNLVPGDTNGQPDIFLFDRLSGITTLVSANRFGTASGNNRSLTPVFSGDGRTLSFVSWASDLVAGDFNNNADVFEVGLYSSPATPAFTVTVLPTAPPELGTWLSWPAVPAISYRVEFKDNLSDPVWQPLSAPISVMGDRASAKDPTLPGSTRFYRVVAYSVQ